MSSQPLIRARGINHAYGTTAVLHGIDLDIFPGSSIALMGPSGSGKTTLLHALAGILVPSRGTVEYFDGQQGLVVSALTEERRTRLRRSDFGLIFQSGQLLDELTVVENVALPLLVDGAVRRQAIQLAEQTIVRLGLDGMGRRHPGQLSGGQRQRVAIARALVTSPRIYFADEPTGSLDSTTAAEVMDTLQSLSRQTGAALVVVTHDPQMASRCDHTVYVHDGRLQVTELMGPTV